MATIYGLEVYDAYNHLTYSSADVTWNQVDYFTVTALPSTTVQNYYAVIIGKEVLVLQLLIDSPPTDRKSLAHTITKNTTTGMVTVTGGSENALILVLMR